MRDWTHATRDHFGYSLIQKKYARQTLSVRINGVNSDIDSFPRGNLKTINTGRKAQIVGERTLVRRVNKCPVLVFILIHRSLLLLSKTKVFSSMIIKDKPRTRCILKKKKKNMTKLSTRILLLAVLAHTQQHCVLGSLGAGNALWVTTPIAPLGHHCPKFFGKDKVTLLWDYPITTEEEIKTS